MNNKCRSDCDIFSMCLGATGGRLTVLFVKRRMAVLPARERGQVADRSNCTVVKNTMFLRSSAWPGLMDAIPAREFNVRPIRKTAAMSFARRELASTPSRDLCARSDNIFERRFGVTPGRSPIGNSHHSGIEEVTASSRRRSRVRCGIILEVSAQQARALCCWASCLPNAHCRPCERRDP
jgi:hypothetical protein